MGGALSISQTTSTQQHAKLQRNEQEVVKLMMPVYFLDEEVSLEDRTAAATSWELILNERSPVFLARRGTADFHYHSSITFFYDSFYLRLFDVHPMCRALFKNGMKSQGKFLVKMISLALSELEDRNKFEKNLVKLALMHYERGVKAVEYGIVGEVLFWVLKQVLGPAVYTAELHTAWIKIYSRMLKTIVPVAVALELKTTTGGNSMFGGKVSGPPSSNMLESRMNDSRMECSASQGGILSDNHDQYEQTNDHCESEKERLKENYLSSPMPTATQTTMKM